MNYLDVLEEDPPADIVARLRADAEGWHIQTEISSSFSSKFTAALEREAADEIERLRSETERLRAELAGVEYMLARNEEDQRRVTAQLAMAQMEKKWKVAR